jgi:hypothetical protein
VLQWQVARLSLSRPRQHAACSKPKPRPTRNMEPQHQPSLHVTAPGWRTTRRPRMPGVPCKRRSRFGEADNDLRLPSSSTYSTSRVY